MFGIIRMASQGIRAGRRGIRRARLRLKLTLRLALRGLIRAGLAGAGLNPLRAQLRVMMRRG